MSKTWLRRAKEGFMQAMGAHVATEDAEFDCRLRSFTTHVQELQRIKQLMELWMESLEAFCASSHMLSEQWKLFYTHSPYSSNQSPFLGVAAEMDRILCNIHLVMQPAIKEAFSARCLQPVQAVLALVPRINERLQERRALLLDYDAYRAKVQSKAASAGLDVSSRKTEKFNETTLKYRAVQEEILSNLSEFEQARPVTLGPELVSFAGCIHSFASVLGSSTSQLLPFIPQAATSIHRVATAAAELTQHPARNRYSTKLGRIPEGFRALRDDSLKPVDPVYSRSDYAGGSFGGYSQTSSTTTATAAATHHSDRMEPIKMDLDSIPEESGPVSSSTQNSTPFAASSSPLRTPRAATFDGSAVSRATMPLPATPTAASAPAELTLPTSVIPFALPEEPVQTAGDSECTTPKPSLDSSPWSPGQAEETNPRTYAVDGVAVDAFGFPVTSPSTPVANRARAGTEDESVDAEQSALGDGSRPFSDPVRPVLPVFSGPPRNSAPPPKPPRRASALTPGTTLTL